MQFALSDSTEELSFDNIVKRWISISNSYYAIEMMGELLPYDQDGNIINHK